MSHRQKNRQLQLVFAPPPGIPNQGLNHGSRSRLPCPVAKSDEMYHYTMVHLEQPDRLQQSCWMLSKTFETLAVDTSFLFDKLIWPLCCDTEHYAGTIELEEDGNSNDLLTNTVARGPPNQEIQTRTGITIHCTKYRHIKHRNMNMKYQTARVLWLNALK